MSRCFTALLALLAFAGCSGRNDPPPPPPLPVEVVTIAPQAVPNVIELPGRVEPVRMAEVRARVTGIVQRRLYVEGTDVQAGQPLFLIDPRELRATFAQTRASLERAKATAANARAVVERYKPLVAENSSNVPLIVRGTQCASYSRVGKKQDTPCRVLLIFWRINL